MTSPDPTEAEEQGGLAAAIRARTASVLHFTHNDLDAVGADAIHRRKYGEVFTIFCSVGKFSDIFSFVANSPGKENTISISDLGFQKSVIPLMKKAKANGWKIEWRDHHRWTDEELATARENVDYLSVDTATCGTGLVARDLLPEDPVAREVARVVCDYDLWKHEDPRSAVLGQILQRRKNREYVRDRLAEGIFEDDYIRREYNQIQKEMHGIFRRSRKRATITDGKYRILFAPMYGYPSETAAYLRKEFKSQIEVLVAPDGKFSIRSVPNISHILARQFNGGGHPNAAGGSFDFTFTDRLLFWALKRSRHFDQFLEIAEKTDA